MYGGGGPSFPPGRCLGEAFPPMIDLPGFHIGGVSSTTPRDAAHHACGAGGGGGDESAPFLENPPFPDHAPPLPPLPLLLRFDPVPLTADEKKGEAHRGGEEGPPVRDDIMRGPDGAVCTCGTGE